MTVAYVMLLGDVVKSCIVRGPSGRAAADGAGKTRVMSLYSAPIIRE